MQQTANNKTGPTPKTAINETEKDVSLSGPSFWTWRRFLPVAVLMALGVAFFVTFFFLVRGYERERKKDLFARIAQSQIQAFFRRANGDLEALLSVGHFFAASQEVDEGEFHRFVQGPLKWHTEIESFEWVPAVPAEQRRAFEENYGIAIHELNSDERVVPASEREIYYPIRFAESLGGTPFSRGYDIGSDPITRHAIETALQSGSGNLVATERLPLPQDANSFSSGTGVRILLPVYRNEMSSTNAMGSRPRILGFLAAVLRPSAMIRTTIYASSAEKLNVCLFDRSAPDDAGLLDAQFSDVQAPRPTSLQEALAGDASTMVTESVQIANRLWTLVCKPSEGFAWKGDWEAWAVLVGGILLTGLLSSYLYTLLGQAAYVENLITKRTRELAAMNVRLQNEIAERERGENALKESEAHYQSLVDTVPMNILRKNLEGRITFGNRLYCETMGIPQDRIVGKTDFDLFPEELARKYVADDRKVIESKRIFEGVEKHRRRDGSLAHMQVLKAPVTDAGGKVVGIQVIFWDVTEKKVAEDHLKQTLDDLARSNRDLEQFAYVASHDLQEPLRMIASYTKLLSKRFEENVDGEAAEFVHYAVEGAVRMQQLINDLLAYSRLGSRGHPFEEIAMEQVVRDTLANLQISIDENCALITNDPLPKVHGDRVQLTQLLQNLLSNSIKFKSDQSPKIHVSAVEKDRHWIFSVRDNGIGLDPQYADRIFVIFQRLHTRDKYPGTGIGLAICKKIVERHGGEIWVESKPGKGATFYFSLPVIRQS